MEKRFFGKLKRFEELLNSEGWQDLMFLDYNDKNDLAIQLKDKIDFFRDNETHWIEIEKCSNCYN